MSNIQQALGGRIRSLRAKKGWTQMHFADVCGLHRSHMGQIERGESNVTIQTLVIVTEKLGVSLAALFTGLKRM